MTTQDAFKQMLAQLIRPGSAQVPDELIRHLLSALGVDGNEDVATSATRGVHQHSPNALGQLLLSVRPENLRQAGLSQDLFRQFLAHVDINEAVQFLKAERRTGELDDITSKCIDIWDACRQIEDGIKTDVDEWELEDAVRARHDQLVFLSPSVISFCMS
jgi:hypothetical protein